MLRNHRMLGKLAVAAATTLSVIAAAGAAQANSERVLYSFTGGSDGGSPKAALIIDDKGNVYGTTQSGGAGHGVVFKVSPRGKETVLYSFTGGNDGDKPSGALVMDRSGNLYGTTEQGGANGHGVVFELTRRGREIVLHSFADGADGALPWGGLTIGADGDLYGATAGGPSNGGIIFKLSRRGRETVLYKFSGGDDGRSPNGGLVMDANGNLFGTTQAGGAHDEGTVFKLSSRGREVVLHSFANRRDGGLPLAGLISDANGNLYGTTELGGGHGEGLVFKFSPRGRETRLHSFFFTPDGAFPFAGLFRAANGDLYGTTSVGGDSDRGTVFKISRSGRETVLYSFTGEADGSEPDTDVIMDAKGNLLGATPKGGANDAGVVFKVNN